MEQGNKLQQIETKLTGTTSPTLSWNQQVVQASEQTKLLYESDLRTKFKQLVSKINILLGGTVENLPVGEEMEVMLNYALDNWYKLSINEIELAVHANLNRKTGEFVQFFGKISVAYIQSCIVNYQEVKQRAILEERRKKASQTFTALPDTPDYIINEKLYDGLIDYVKTQKAIPQFWDWWRVYDHMTEKGMLSHLTVEWKRDLWEQVKTDLAKVKTETKLQAQSVKEIRDAETIGQDDEIKRECIRRTVHLIIQPYLGIQ
jgi:hypothetical protein